LKNQIGDFMKFKLSEWANIAEIIGAVAIIVSLIYVSVQVKDSTRAIKSTATNDAATAMQSWYQTVGSNEQTSRVFYIGMTDPDVLSREEMFQFIMITHAAFLAFQNSYLLAEQGTLDPEIRVSITNTLLATKDLPGYKIYWRQRGPLFNKSFREFVETMDARQAGAENEVYKPEDAKQE
jgi:hypothetical protein